MLFLCPRAPPNPRAYYSLANMYRIENRFSGALSHCRRAIEISPDDPIASGNIARLLSVALAGALPPFAQSGLSRDPGVGAELFRALSQQYARAGKAQLSLDAEAVARRLAVAGDS